MKCGTETGRQDIVNAYNKNIERTKKAYTSRMLCESKSIRVAFPDTGLLGKRYYLPQDPTILNNKIRGFYIPTSLNDAEISGSYSFTGQTSAYMSEASMMYSYLTLVDSCGVEKYKDLVLYDFMLSHNSGQMRLFMNENIDTSKSYIRYIGATADLSANTYLLINFLLDK